jgi:hypothetical protein
MRSATKQHIGCVFKFHSLILLRVASVRSSLKTTKREQQQQRKSETETIFIYSALVSRHRHRSTITIVMRRMLSSTQVTAAMENSCNCCFLIPLPPTVAVAEQYFSPLHHHRALKLSPECFRWIIMKLSRSSHPATSLECTRVPHKLSRVARVQIYDTCMSILWTNCRKFPCMVMMMKAIRHEPLERMANYPTDRSPPHTHTATQQHHITCIHDYQFSASPLSLSPSFTEQTSVIVDMLCEELLENVYHWRHIKIIR